MILDRQIEICVSTPSAIQAVLKRSGSSEQVMHAVSEDFKFHIVKEQENGEGEEVLSLESIDKDESPIIKLMHTTIFDAIQRRASDIHIEATDKNVLIKYRIDGVLYPATEPIDIKFHSAMVSRIKVMSDLDIAERRVPQDGRFKLRTGGKTIDFRVSILPSAFGEDVVIRILDKESITAGVNTLRLESLGFDENDLAQVPEEHPRALRHGARYRTDRKRQDHDPVRRPDGDQHRRGQVHHHRGPGGVPAPGR